MVTCSRLRWILDELDSGRQSRLRLNSFQDKVIMHIVLLPCWDKRNMNFVAVAALREFMASLDHVCSVDHGHRNSCGESLVTIVAKNVLPTTSRDGHEAADVMPIVPGSDVAHQSPLQPACEVVSLSLESVEQQLHQLQQQLLDAVEEKFRDEVAPRATEYLQRTMTAEMLPLARLNRDTVCAQLASQLAISLRDGVQDAQLLAPSDTYGTSIHDFCNKLAILKAPTVLDKILGENSVSLSSLD